MLILTQTILEYCYCSETIIYLFSSYFLFVPIDFNETEILWMFLRSDDYDYRHVRYFGFVCFGLSKDFVWSETHEKERGQNVIFCSSYRLG